MKKLLIATGCFGLIFTGQLLMGQSADSGKSLFDVNCLVCHNADSTDRKMGPGLKGLTSRDLNNGNKATDENVLAVIDRGGNGMPAFADLLTAEDKANLVAYLKTL